MQFSVNAQAFKPAYQACLILQTAEANCLEELLESFVTPEVLANKLANYNFNYVLAELLKRLDEKEQIALLAYANFAFWPRQYSYLVIKQPLLLKCLLANTWQMPIEEYVSKVAEFDDLISDARPIKLEHNLSQLSATFKPETNVAELTDLVMQVKNDDIEALDLLNLPPITLEAQANYNCLRLLQSLYNITSTYLADDKFWPTFVNRASLAQVWQIVIEQVPVLLRLLPQIDAMSDEMSSLLVSFTKHSANDYLPILIELGQAFLTELNKVNQPNILATDAKLLVQFNLLFAADQALFGAKKAALQTFYQQNLQAKPDAELVVKFRQLFVQIFDTVLARNSGNIYLTEFLLEANDLELAKRLQRYIAERYSQEELLKLRDGQKEWLRALAYYNLQFKQK